MDRDEIVNLLRISAKNNNVRLPRDIDFSMTYNVLKIHVNRPTENMQENSAAFEGWCLVLKAHNVCDKIIFSFKRVFIDENNYCNNLTSTQQHYIRFLYRLNKFQQQFNSWFEISSINTGDLQVFRDKFINTIKINNIPLRPSTFNVNHGLEHILEKMFVNYSELRESCGINYSLNDQLPVGIFKESISEVNKIINTGFVDLWGISDDNSLCIYELKIQGNIMIGIISELYFYANILRDLVLGNDNFTLIRVPCDHRNYNALTYPINSICGCFLVSDLHPAIESKRDEILNMLNENMEIKYEILYYNIEEENYNRMLNGLLNRD
ncbi:MAG: hypothetical protein WCH34_08550 [Bacteroidota bacterium]